MTCGLEHFMDSVNFEFLVEQFQFVCSANRFLRLHGKLVGLANDFLIIDPDDQLTIIKRILKEQVVEKHFFTDKPKAIVNFINKSKDEGKRATDIIVNNENRFQQMIYMKYESYIRQENKIDFGELILLTKGFTLKRKKKFSLIYFFKNFPFFY